MVVNSISTESQIRYCALHRQSLEPDVSYTSVTLLLYTHLADSQWFKSIQMRTVHPIIGLFLQRGRVYSPFAAHRTVLHIRLKKESINMSRLMNKWSNRN